MVYLHRYVDGNGAVIEAEQSGLHHVEPHPDLLAVMAALSPHFANLVEAEDYGSKECAAEKIVESASAEFPVKGCIFKKTDKYEGCQLSGFRKLSTGHACNMLTRLVKFNEASEQYDLADELAEVVERLRAETVLLLGGKHAKPAQTTITDPEQQEVPVED